MKKTWKIGTRGSLLALTQCRQIKELIESRTGESFELVIIKTRGDQQTDVPLWQLEGKDFFTRELDMALLANEVDLVVHSYKDLGSERPEGISLAAITERKFGHDILLIPNDKVHSLQSGTLKHLVVGTSSPRRIVNLTNGLPKIMPGNPKIETKTLRGNVNTRVKKLKDGEYDAIVLAMPGLERLALDEAATKELAPLLKDMNFMVLPASIFPWAASQGALAIEMHEHSPAAAKLKEVLGSVHDAATAEAVKRERKAFNDYGGGCHLAVGVAVMSSGERFVHSHRGERDTDKITKLFLEPEVKAVSSAKTFVGMPNEDELLEKTVNGEQIDCGKHDVFVTSSHVIDAVKNGASFWAAGTKTWEKLATKGQWVNGAADSLGEGQLKAFETSALLKLLRGKDFSWLVLSGEEAKSTLGPVKEVYGRKLNDVSEQFVQRISETTDFFWTSYPQYAAYAQRFPNIKDKRHWCGLGKTFEAFAAKDMTVIPVSGINEFREKTQSK